MYLFPSIDICFDRRYCIATCFFQGAESLANSEKVGAILRDQEERGGWIGAICAGPLALDRHDIGKGTPAQIADGEILTTVTSHPSVAERLKAYNYRWILKLIQFAYAITILIQFAYAIIILTQLAYAIIILNLLIQLAYACNYVWLSKPDCAIGASD